MGEQGKNKDRGKVVEMRRDEEEEVLKEKGGMGRGMEGNQGREVRVFEREGRTEN